MAKKYLDDSGMSYFWGKLKDYFQAKLVSGTNIKTINNESILGSGNIQVPSTSSDYVVEQGTSGNWRYRKWNSGIAECWGQQTVSVNFSQQIVSSLYITSTTTAISYPSFLTSVDSVVCAGTNIQAPTWATLVSGQISTDKTILTAYMGWTTSGTQSIRVSIVLKGRWK